MGQHLSIRYGMIGLLILIANMNQLIEAILTSIVRGGKVLTRVFNASWTAINPATEEKQNTIIWHVDWIESTLSDLASTTYWLKMIFRLLKPLWIVTWGGSNRLSVDVNAWVITTVTTVTTVATVTALTNQTNIGNVNAFTQQQNMARMAYASGIRNNITF